MNDLKFAFRQLLKNPGFTAVAMLTLALGIGANTAVFSVINATLLRPFPYENPERLIILQERNAGGGLQDASYLNFADWCSQSASFESMAAERGRESFNFSGSGEPERLQGQNGSANFFQTRGSRPFPLRRQKASWTRLPRAWSKSIPRRTRESACASSHCMKALLAGRVCRS